MVLTDGYRARTVFPSHGGYGMPRGPLGHVESPQPTAIGFCPRCGTNARRTCSNRGAFDCPRCVHQWVDSRVGEQTRSFEDFVSHA